MANTSFTWKGTDIKTKATSPNKINVNNIYRPMIKPKTRHKVEIPGLAGSYDFGGGVERDYMITVDLTIIANSAANVQTIAAAIETLLTGKESLIFSDEPAVTHTAQLYEAATLTPIGNHHTAQVTLQFECDA